MNGLGISYESISRRIRACDYLVVAQLYLQNNFLLSRPLESDDIKPRLLGHWGTCHGINTVYANLKAHYDNDFQFVLGPGHGFPALQANLFIDQKLLDVDKNATLTEDGIAYLCKNFSWPGGFPSHASPVTPDVICEGGELGYALGTAYGAALGFPEKNIAVLIGDGEFETATALSSMNLVKLFASDVNGRALPILHLNGYKISAPTIYARKSDRELKELIRGFGYEPFLVSNDTPETFQNILAKAESVRNPFIIYRSEKGKTGPDFVNGEKISGNFLAHQIPLKNPKTDPVELLLLENWLKSYRFNELFTPEKGFNL